MTPVVAAGAGAGRGAVPRAGGRAGAGHTATGAWQAPLLQNHDMSCPPQGACGIPWKSFGLGTGTYTVCTGRTQCNRYTKPLSAVPLHESTAARAVLPPLLQVEAGAVPGLRCLSTLSGLVVCRLHGLASGQQLRAAAAALGRLPQLRLLSIGFQVGAEWAGGNAARGHVRGAGVREHVKVCGRHPRCGQAATPKSAPAQRGFLKLLPTRAAQHSLPPNLTRPARNAPLPPPSPQTNIIRRQQRAASILPEVKLRAQRHLAARGAGHPSLGVAPGRQGGAGGAGPSWQQRRQTRLAAEDDGAGRLAGNGTSAAGGEPEPGADAPPAPLAALGLGVRATPAASGRTVPGGPHAVPGGAGPSTSAAEAPAADVPEDQESGDAAGMTAAAAALLPPPLFPAGAFAALQHLDVTGAPEAAALAAELRTASLPALRCAGAAQCCVRERRTADGGQLGKHPCNFCSAA